MRNHLFLLTVLAVTIWTSRGDTTGIGDAQNDFNFDDMEDGSGSEDRDDYLSSYSSYDSYDRGPEPAGSPYPPHDDEDVDIDEDQEDQSSGNLPVVVPLACSMHLNKVFEDDYNRPSSLLYMELDTKFSLAMNELMSTSALRDNYVSTRVLGFSPGSVKVDFEVKLEELVMMEELVKMEDALQSVIERGVSAGSLSELSPNASSLVIKPQDKDPGITFTTMEAGTGGRVTTAPGTKDEGDKYRPTQPKDKDGDEVDVEEKNILDMILGDPIIIAAIVGGLIVILLSIILLFLFVVYRLKKKDEGSYSLDEPTKAKDPTAYWKETKEFYA